MSDLQQVAQQLRALGVELPENPSQMDLAQALAKVSATVRAAKKSLPSSPPAHFEERDRKSGESETVLVVRRGGKGQPLAVTQHAAAILVQAVDALRRFAETGVPQDLPELTEPSDEEE